MGPRPSAFASALVLIAAAVFIFLPVVVLIQYSFQDGIVPVPPFKGFSLRWYEKALENRRLTEALWSSAVVTLVSSLVATVLGFLAAATVVLIAGWSIEREREISAAEVAQMERAR